MKKKTTISLDRTQLLGFDQAKDASLMAKVGNKGGGSGLKMEPALQAMVGFKQQ